MDLPQPWNEPWQPLARAAALAWVVFFGVFLLYAGANWGEFLLVDQVNLVIHEGGHLLFSWLGPTLTLWGGTLLQWLVPLLLAAWFYWQRQPAGFAFCLFFFFENLLYSASYMADARAMALRLVTVGDPEASGHDWNSILGSLGLLEYDTRVAGVVRFMGWVGMLGTTGWTGWKFWRAPNGV
jgi:hypothetical protein